MATRSKLQVSGMLTVLTLVLMAWSGVPAAKHGSAPPEAFRGVVTGWNISAEGDVAIHLTAVVPPVAAAGADKGAKNAKEAKGEKDAVAVDAGTSRAADAEAIKLRQGGFALWFVTPPDRNQTNRFEDLVLEAMLRIAGEPVVVTITGTGSNERSGETLADAIPIESMRWEK